TTLLVAVTALTMVMAARGMPSPLLMLATLLGGLLSAGSANAINCYLDRDIDQLMGRTMRRAVPAGKVSAQNALVFGMVLAVVSFTEMVLFVNLLAASLALSGILFYVFIYTALLKRTTPQNIVIGGAAGAVPALVGWAAVTNTIGLPAFLLFLVIFFWTPPHFWALALLIQRDYERAGIPMLPVVVGEDETRRQIFLYTLLLIVVTVLLFVSGTMGYLYLAAALGLGGYMLYLAYRLLRGDSKLWANRLFWFSNSYLALLFAIMAVDRVIG
ncbi:MAG: heme o synthase, partial [Chloroflexota bacterium]|nr:heme o synthase [Chloroflexota bacterium]